MINNYLLKSEEKAVLSLRSLYRRYGYLPYRMSKFEEYELYIRNKDFLVSDRIITFNDAGGKLMALKPDVTLSIIKSGEDIPGFKQKVCYNENVYRVSDNTHDFREIMQAGLECIGDIDLYDIYEAVTLAAESLSLISDEFVLELSHLGILSSALESVCPSRSFAERALGFIAEKNTHDLLSLCAQYGVSESDAAKLSIFITAYGERSEVISKLNGAFGQIPCEIAELSALLDASPFGDRIRFDFSVVNNMNYYNGFVFKGFIEGIPSGILAGGQYDKMMARMGRKSGAVGFAIYLDQLDHLVPEKNDHDVDILLLYDDNTDKETIARTVGKYISEEKTVSAQKTVPDKFRYGEIVDLRRGG